METEIILILYFYICDNCNSLSKEPEECCGQQMKPVKFLREEIDGKVIAKFDDNFSVWAYVK